MYAQYCTDSQRAVILLPVPLIRPHEQHDPAHAVDLRRSMLDAGMFTHPVIVDWKSMTLLDGHHRFRAAQLLGCAYVPSVMVEYWGDDILITAWRSGETVTREDVLSAAASGKLLPIKTSRHQFLNPAGNCKVPLRVLTTQFA